MNESTLEEGRRQSILKQRTRLPLQEVVQHFTDDDTTTTLTHNRRVSFGRNLVKEFIVGSAASTQALHEYEQSSESVSEPSTDCSGPLDLVLNKTCIDDNSDEFGDENLPPVISPPDSFNDSKRSAPEQRVRPLTECLELAMSMLEDKDTVIIIGSKSTSKEEDRNPHGQLTYNATEIEQRHGGISMLRLSPKGKFATDHEHVNFVPIKHSEIFVPNHHAKSYDKSQFEFLDGPLCMTSPGFSGQNDFFPQHRPDYNMGTDMEETCVNRRPLLRSAFASDPLDLARSPHNYMDDSGMEITGNRPIVPSDISMDEEGTETNPLAFNSNEADDNFLSELRSQTPRKCPKLGVPDDKNETHHNPNDSGEDSIDLCDSVADVRKELENVAEANKSFMQQCNELSKLSQNTSYCADMSQTVIRTTFSAISKQVAEIPNIPTYEAKLPRESLSYDRAENNLSSLNMSITTKTLADADMSTSPLLQDNNSQTQSGHSLQGSDDMEVTTQNISLRADTHEGLMPTPVKVIIPLQGNVEKISFMTHSQEHNDDPLCSVLTSPEGKPHVFSGARNIPGAFDMSRTLITTPVKVLNISPVNNSSVTDTHDSDDMEVTEGNALSWKKTLPSAPSMFCADTTYHLVAAPLEDMSKELELDISTRSVLCEGEKSLSSPAKEGSPLEACALQGNVEKISFMTHSQEHNDDPLHSVLTSPEGKPHVFSCARNIPGAFDMSRTLITTPVKVLNISPVNNSSVTDTHDSDDMEVTEGNALSWKKALSSAPSMFCADTTNHLVAAPLEDMSKEMELDISTRSILCEGEKSLSSPAEEGSPLEACETLIVSNVSGNCFSGNELTEECPSSLEQNEASAEKTNPDCNEMNCTKLTLNNYAFDDKNIVVNNSSPGSAQLPEDASFIPQKSTNLVGNKLLCSTDVDAGLSDPHSANGAILEKLPNNHLALDVNVTNPYTDDCSGDRMEHSPTRFTGKSLKTDDSKIGSIMDSRQAQQSDANSCQLENLMGVQCLSKHRNNIEETMEDGGSGAASNSEIVNTHLPDHMDKPVNSVGFAIDDFRLSPEKSIYDGALVHTEPMQDILGASTSTQDSPSALATATKLSSVVPACDSSIHSSMSTASNNPIQIIDVHVDLFSKSNGGISETLANSSLNSKSVLSTTEEKAGNVSDALEQSKISKFPNRNAKANFEINETSGKRMHSPAPYKLNVKKSRISNSPRRLSKVLTAELTCDISAKDVNTQTLIEKESCVYQDTPKKSEPKTRLSSKSEDDRKEYDVSVENELTSHEGTLTPSTPSQPAGAPSNDLENVATEGTLEVHMAGLQMTPRQYPRPTEIAGSVKNVIEDVENNAQEVFHGNESQHRMIDSITVHSLTKVRAASTPFRRISEHQLTESAIYPMTYLSDGGEKQVEKFADETKRFCNDYAKENGKGEETYTLKLAGLSKRMHTDSPLSVKHSDKKTRLSSTPKSLIETNFFGDTDLDSSKNRREEVMWDKPFSDTFGNSIGNELDVSVTLNDISLTMTDAHNMSLDRPIPNCSVPNSCTLGLEKSITLTKSLMGNIASSDEPPSFDETSAEDIYDVPASFSPVVVEEPVLSPPDDSSELQKCMRTSKLPVPDASIQSVEGIVQNSVLNSSTNRSNASLPITVFGKQSSIGEFPENKLVSEIQELSVNRSKPMLFKDTLPEKSIDIKVREQMVVESREAGCLWRLQHFETCSENSAGGVVQVRFPLLADSFLLQIKFSKEGAKRCVIKEIDCLHVIPIDFQWPKQKITAAFGFKSFKKFVASESKKMISDFEELPYCMMYFNSFSKKLSYVLEQTVTVLKGCASSRLVKQGLRFQVISYALTVICIIEINLQDILELGCPSLVFEHELGYLNEDCINTILANSWQGPTPILSFIRAVRAFIIEEESRVGLITKRSPILF